MKKYTVKRVYKKKPLYVKSSDSLFELFEFIQKSTVTGDLRGVKYVIEVNKKCNSN